MPMKRQFTHWVVSQAFKKTWDNAGVVDGFAKLGYLGPQFAELRSGMLECRALSNMLRVRIDVYQSCGCCHHFVPQGDLSLPLLTLSFHFHLMNAAHFQILEMR